MSAAAKAPAKAAAKDAGPERSWNVGDRVLVAGRNGTVRFYGTTNFSAGIWAGVELEEPVGKNDGSVKGESYFSCPAEHGIFVRGNLCSPAEGAAAPAPPAKSSPDAAKAKAASPPAKAAASPAKTAAKAEAKAEAKVGEKVVPASRSSQGPAKKSEGASPAKAVAPKSGSAASPAAAKPSRSSDRSSATSATPKGALKSDAHDAQSPRTPRETSPPAGSKARLARPSSESAKIAASVSELPASKATASSLPTEAEKPKAPSVSIPSVQPEAASAPAVVELPAEHEVLQLRQQVERLRADMAQRDREIVDERRGVEEAKAAAAAAVAALPTSSRPPEDSAEMESAEAELQAAATAIVQLRTDVAKHRAEAQQLSATSKTFHEQLAETKQTASAHTSRAGEAVKRASLVKMPGPASAHASTAQKQADELTKQLNAATLAREVLEDKLQELELELEEQELLKEEREAIAASGGQASGQNGGREGSHAEKLDEFKAAIVKLDAAAKAEKTKLQKQAEELDNEVREQTAGADGVARLIYSLDSLGQRKAELEKLVTGLERQSMELNKVTQAGSMLQDTQAAAASELQRQLESIDRRVVKLEDLVWKLRREELEERRCLAGDEKKAKELLERVQASSDSQAENASAAELVARRRLVVAASVRLRVARLAEHAERARAEAHRDCVPTGWAEPITQTTTTSESTGAKPCVVATSKRAEAVGRIERILWKAEAVARHVCDRHLAPLQPGDPASKWFADVSLTSGRCAAAAAAALGSLASECDGIQDSEVSAVHEKSLLRAELQDAPAYADGEAQLDELLANCRAGQLGPGAPLTPLQDLEKGLCSLLPGQELKRGLSRRCVALALQRLQVAFRYGVVSQPEGSIDVDVLRGICSQLEDLSLRLLDGSEPAEPCAKSAAADSADEARGGAESSRLPPELIEKVVAVESFVRNAMESETERRGSIASFFRGSQENTAVKVLTDAAPGVVEGLNQLQGLILACSSDPPRRLRAAPLPSWTKPCSAVQREVADIFEMQIKSVGLRKTIAERKTGLAARQQEYSKISERHATLATDLGNLTEVCDRIAELDDEAEVLKKQAKQDTIQQSMLDSDLDIAHAKRDEQERSKTDAANELSSLHGNADGSQRPLELEGRASAPELAALRSASQKDARELYTLRVSVAASRLGIGRPPDVALALTATPGAAAGATCGASASSAVSVPTTGASTAATTLSTCLSHYADVHRELLLEQARVRLPRLDAPSETGAAGGPVSGEETLAGQVARAQQLQLRLAGIRAAAKPLASSLEAAASAKDRTTTGTVASKAAAVATLVLPCPQWALGAVQAPKGPIPVGYEELRAIHAVMVN